MIERLEKLLTSLSKIKVGAGLTPIVFYQEVFHFFHDLKSILALSHGSPAQQEQGNKTCEQFRSLAHAQTVLDEEKLNLMIKEKLTSAKTLQDVFGVASLIQNHQHPFTASLESSAVIQKAFAENYMKLEPLSKAKVLSCAHFGYQFKKEHTTLPLSEVMSWEEKLTKSFSTQSEHCLLAAKTIEPANQGSALVLKIEYWIAQK